MVNFFSYFLTCSNHSTIHDVVGMTFQYFCIELLYWILLYFFNTETGAPDKRKMGGGSKSQILIRMDFHK